MKQPKLKQALPSAAIIPRAYWEGSKRNKPGGWEVSKVVQDELTRIAEKAYNREMARESQKSGKEDQAFEPDSVIMAPVRAKDAAEWYVSVKAHETPLPEFRKMLRGGKSGGSLREAIDALVAELPATDAGPPFSQMRSLYCYNGPEANGNEEASDEELEQRFQREDEWDARLSPAAIKAILVLWQNQMNTLLPMTGTGRTEVVAERAFVRSLARYWTEELGARLRISRGDGGYGEKSSEQSGLFPDFVHAAAEIIPPEYRPVSWDHTVREIVEQKT